MLRVFVFLICVCGGGDSGYGRAQVLWWCIECVSGLRLATVSWGVLQVHLERGTGVRFLGNSLSSNTKSHYSWCTPLLTQMWTFACETIRQCILFAVMAYRFTETWSQVLILNAFVLWANYFTSPRFLQFLPLTNGGNDIFWKEFLWALDKIMYINGSM